MWHTQYGMGGAPPLGPGAPRPAHASADADVIADAASDGAVATTADVAVGAAT